jgi:hypothetical protein
MGIVVVARPGRPYLGRCRRKDDVNLPGDELRCEIERLIGSLGPLKVNSEISALDISQVAKTGPESVHFAGPACCFAKS